MENWDLLVDRDDYRNTELAEAEPAELADGQVRVRVDAFGFTANNVTYAAAGDLVGYWTFFPVADRGDGVKWGRVPVWGFGEVVESRSDLVIGGDRLFGYFPMSTELVITPAHVTDQSLVDGSEHRAALPAVYNRYVRCGADPGYDPELEAEQMVYRPLFFTSFLIDDVLADHDLYGASTVVLASASSKTAFGTAHLLSRRGGVQVVGLTSPANVEFVEGLGCYDVVLPYDRIAELPAGPAVLVDMSGNAAIVGSVHERYGDDLRHSMIVGITHWEDRGGSDEPLPGPAQEFFFAPARIQQRHADWGPGELESRLAEAWLPFVEQASAWVTIEHREGAEAVRDVFHATLEGRTPPDVAHVLHP